MGELEELMQEMLDVNEQIKALKDKKENIKSNILINIKLNDITEHRTDDMRLTFKSSTRRTIDKDMLEEYLGKNNKCLDEFKTESEFEALRVVKLGGE